MNELLNRIERLCAERGITGSRMCADLGMSKSFMTELRKGRAKTVTVETAARIADYFGVTTDYLLGKENKSRYFYGAGDDKRRTILELDDIYLRLAKEASDLALDEEDINTILSIYRRHREKNNG